MFYELAATTFGDEEKAVLHEVIESGYFTMGPRVKAFEREFADYHGAKYGVMVNSGSSANLAVLAALAARKKKPIQPGDEAIVPAISWSTTYHPLQQYGMKLRFVDVELETLNIDTAQLEAALTPKTRMIVAVSILGNPANLQVLRDFADKHDLILFEDNCEACDAELNGKKTGTFGHLNTFSFFFSHHISTMEGGMVLTDDEELYHLLISVRAHGWTRDLPEGSPLFERGEEDLFEAYRFIVPGYNLRPSELNGAVGSVQLKKLPAMTAMRRKNLKLFQKLFGDDDRFIIQRENGKSSSFCFTVILHPDKNLDREKIFAALKEADIGFRIITGGCFLRHDVISYYDHDVVGNVDNANLAHDRGFFVGNHPFDLTEQLTKFRAVMDEACR